MVLTLGLVAIVMAVVLYRSDGDSGSATEEEREYFLQLETADLSFSRKTRELSADLEGIASQDLDAQEQLQLAHEFSRGLFVEYDRHVERLSSLQPPESVRSAHEDYLSTTQELAQLWDDILSDVNSSERPPNILDVLGNDRFLQIGQDYDEACMNLLGEARKREMNIVLTC